MPTIADLKDKREELDATLDDVGARLADLGTHDLAASTLSSRVSEWERGVREPTDADLAALEDALDAIEAEQNFEFDDCAKCGRTPQFEPVETDRGPLCIACDYGENGP